jgi:AraC-like DNA-binding protein
MQQRGVSVIWVRGLIDALASSGLDMTSLCREADLDLVELITSNAVCPTEKLSLLWELAEARSGNPAIGLTSQQTFKPASFDVVGYAMMSSESLAAGLERLVRYMRILTDAQTLSLSQQGTTTVVSLEIYGGERPLPRQRFESAFINLLSFFRWLSGRDLRPLRVDLIQPTPMDLAPYKDLFRCPLHFSAASNRIVFASADLALPLPTSDAVMSELHDHFAAQRLEQIDDRRISSKVRELLIRKFPEGEPAREQIARLLCMSERSLQRHLNSEGTSFHQLIDQTRRELAVSYLAQPRISLGEVVYLLGFAGQSNLTRACKRWFDLSPRQYRLQLGAGSVGAISESVADLAKRK